MPRSTALNGFAALRDLDWNNDARIDTSDSAWPHLRLWRDANHDGASQSSEIAALAHSGIEAIG